jgi:hypothetical protein
MHAQTSDYTNRLLSGLADSASGEEIALPGWTDSLRTQEQGFALADFIGVLFNTTA